MISPLDLNLLLVLDAVLTERSVARAAHRLHVTPSAVSNALARLRRIVGDQLITKKGRGIVPTPRALELAPVLARTLRELHDAVRVGGFNPETTTRRFTIALSDVMQVVLLPWISALLAREMPLAQLRSVSSDSLLLLGGLAGPEVDVVIGPQEADSGIHAEPLLHQATVLICREDHPALAKKPDPRSIGALRHVAVEAAPGHGFRDIAGVAYAQAGFVRNVGVTVPTFSAAAAVVAATDFVATVPALLLDVIGPRLRLRALPLPIPRLTVVTNLCWHDRTDADPAAVAFREIVRRAAASAPLSGGSGGSGKRPAGPRARRARAGP